MRAFTLRSTTYGLLTAGVIVLCACGGPREPQKPDAPPASAPHETPAAAPGQVRATPSANVQGFEPELLLSDRRTSRFRATLPLTAARLSDATPYVLQVQVVVECANARTQQEVESKKTDLSLVVEEVLSGKSRAFVSSTAGKIQLQEEIASRLQQTLENKGVKQVHYGRFAVERGR